MPPSEPVGPSFFWYCVTWTLHQPLAKRFARRVELAAGSEGEGRAKAQSEKMAADRMVATVQRMLGDLVRGIYCGRDRYIGVKGKKRE